MTGVQTCALPIYLDLAERNGRSVSGFYRADAEGETFLAKVQTALDDGLAKNKENPEPYLQEVLGSAWLSDEQCAALDIAMEEGQALRSEERRVGKECM